MLNKTMLDGDFVMVPNNMEILFRLMEFSYNFQ
jgi:hypothetical protein